MQEMASETRHTTITITRITDKGDGFAVTDDGYGVYISPSLVARYAVEEGERRIGRLMENNPDRIEQGIPWRAFYVSPTPCADDERLDETTRSAARETPQEDTPLTPEEALEAEILRRGVITTAEAADVLDVDTVLARRVLDRLHRHGAVVRADVYTSPTQAKASKALWARSEAALRQDEG